MSSPDKRWPYLQALKIATEIKSALAPYCERIEIAGSIRRRKKDAGDIELVFVNGGTSWGEKNKLAIHAPSGIAVDLFSTTLENWWVTLAIRTGGKATNLKLTNGQSQASSGRNPRSGNDRKRFSKEVLPLSGNSRQSQSNAASPNPRRKYGIAPEKARLQPQPHERRPIALESFPMTKTEAVAAILTILSGLAAGIAISYALTQ